jgi:predicted PurR-regulated permease PerM
MSAPPAGRSRYGEILAAIVVVGVALYIIGSTAELFLLLFLAVLLGIYLSVIADFGVRRAHLSRPLALAGAVVFTVLLLAGFVLLVWPPVAEQLRALVASLPTTLANLDQSVDDIAARIPGLAGVYHPGEHRILLAFADQLSEMATGAARRLFGAAPRVLAAASVGVMAIYLAAEPSRYTDAVVALLPPRERPFALSIVDDLARSMRGWLVGQFINMSILGVLMALGLLAIGVPYWLAFGVFTFAAALVPFFGSLVSTLLPALVVLGQGSPGRALAVVAWGLAVHLIEGNILAPLVMAVEVELPPVVTMFGILVMGALMGPIGVLTAVPVIAVVDVLTRRILVERIYPSERFRLPPPPPDAPPAAPPST